MTTSVNVGYNTVIAQYQDHVLVNKKKLRMLSNIANILKCPEMKIINNEQLLALCFILGSSGFYEAVLIFFDEELIIQKYFLSNPGLIAPLIYTEGSFAVALHKENLYNEISIMF